MISTVTSINNISVQGDNKQFFKTVRPVTNTVTNPVAQKKLTKNEKLGIQMSTALGVLASLMLLAKTSKRPYSLNLKRMVSTPFKETFLGKEDYTFGKVLTVGAGSCLGGLAGGLVFDKNKNNRQAKYRETLNQYINISLPISTVAGADWLVKKVTPKLSPLAGKTCGILFPIIGLATGIIAGNKIANKLNTLIFHKKEKRPIELTDMPAHLDDICMTSQYIAKDNIVTKLASRFVPIALMVAGNEIGKKQEKQV